MHTALQIPKETREREKKKTDHHRDRLKAIAIADKNTSWAVTWRKLRKMMSGRCRAGCVPEPVARDAPSNPEDIAQHGHICGVHGSPRVSCFSDALTIKHLLKVNFLFTVVIRANAYPAHDLSNTICVDISDNLTSFPFFKSLTGK